MKNPFAKAEGKRIKLTNAQRKQIKKLYKSAANDLKKEQVLLKNKTNISSTMRDMYLNDLRKKIDVRIKEIGKHVENDIKENMLEVVKSVLDDNKNLLSLMGFSNISNSYIANDIVNEIVSGKLYKGRWNLSKAIWSDQQKKLNDINEIIAKGVIEQRTTYEIAKDLEKYVNPSAKKDWNWSKVYPGVNKVIDYNAQRLARTMISHAYQESFVRSTKDNPFIVAYRWLASGSDRMCPICEDRDGQIFAKDDLPLDHPNGMCTFEIVMDMSYTEIGEALADWINDEGDEKLNQQIDKFAHSLNRNGKMFNYPKHFFVNKKILKK